MIAITDYQNGEHMETEILHDKDMFLEFFEIYHREDCIAAGYFSDVVTGIEQEIDEFLDELGNFWWTTYDVYHFKKYDLKLRDAFKAFVRSRMKHHNTLSNYILNE